MGGYCLGACDLHIWNMSPDHPMLTAHVTLKHDVRWPILTRIGARMLRDKHKIEAIPTAGMGG